MIRLKTAEEIARIQESGAILRDSLEEVSKYIEPGITTHELDKVIHQFILSKKAKPAFLHYQDYPAASCISVNQVVIHGIPGKYKLREGDIVGIDVGVDYKGFISDSAVTFGVGTLSPLVQKLVQVTQESLYLAIEAAKFGNRIKDIGKAVSSHAFANRFDVVRDFCGHGVGFAVHEEPSIPNYVDRSSNNPRLKAGMVLAIEPMVNIGTGDVFIKPDGWTVETVDGKWSAHFEHTVAIFEDRTEILT